MENEVVDITSDEDEDLNDFMLKKPIMALFRRLISNQSTVFTNAQILYLLKVEFGINVKLLSEFEIDIYISVMKKFLKDWPQWDEFDRTVNQHKKSNNHMAIEVMLNSKYDDLKTYLKSIMDIAVLSANKAVEDLKEKNKNSDENSKDDTDLNNRSQVSLEICGTRSQLNNIILRHPTSKVMVFNVHNDETTIKLQKLPLNVIFNLWNILIQVRVKVNDEIMLYYSRETRHKLKHTLVNKTLETNPCFSETYNLNLQIKNDKRNKTIIRTDAVVNKLKKIASKLSEPDDNESKLILDLVAKEICFDKTLAVPGHFKRYLNEYSYKRYLFVDNFNENDVDMQYDLQLEEILTPSYEMYVGDFDISSFISDSEIIVKCVLCNESFTGRHVVCSLQEHFQEHALEKIPWTCMKCNREFQMNDLAATWWCHKCTV